MKNGERSVKTWRRRAETAISHFVAARHLVPALGATLTRAATAPGWSGRRKPRSERGLGIAGWRSASAPSLPREPRW
jgi:hypothetical protein